MKKWITSLTMIFLTMAMLLLTGCGSDSSLPEIPGVKGPQFNVLDGKVMITLKLLKANMEIGGKAPIPKTRDSYFEVSPNIEDGGLLVVFYLDIEDLRSLDIGVGDGNTLPDGRAIPGIPGGTLQDSIRLDTELLDLSFYYHKTLFGMFLPLGWDTNGFGGYWNVVINNKNIGLLGAVASDQAGNGAGIILFLKLDVLKDKQFKQLIEKSKRNPHIMY